MDLVAGHLPAMFDGHHDHPTLVPATHGESWHAINVIHSYKRSLPHANSLAKRNSFKITK